MRRAAAVLSALAALRCSPDRGPPAGAADHVAGALPVPPLRDPRRRCPTQTRPGTNDWTCKPTAAHPRPVVLVHGTAGNRSTNWQTYGPLLRNNGYCVFALTYGVPAGSAYPASALGGMNDIASSAQELRRLRRQGLAATGPARSTSSGTPRAP